MAYHTKFKPKLNLIRYALLANGEIETVYQWNRWQTEEQRLVKSQHKAILKPLLTYRLDKQSSLNKLKGKIWYDNKNKAGIYRWVNRVNKKSYVGCSFNLGNIMGYYLTLQQGKAAVNSKNRRLVQAFQQYGLTSFNLQILAYCGKEELATKEQYYQQLYQPDALV